MPSSNARARRATEARVPLLPNRPVKIADIDISTMTLSRVAVVTDVLRGGRPVIGCGFNADGPLGRPEPARR